MSSLYNELKALIYDESNKERECREYLEHAADLLFRGPGVDIACDVEYRGHRGDSDYIVSGRGHESGTDCILAYIWELKAPQCFLFMRDPNSHNRLIPSKDLIQAENQLLNYYDELRGSADFRADLGIVHPSNVYIGGIIIGCDKTKVEGNLDETTKARLFEKALRCRNFFYKSENIRLMLWNSILDHLRQPEETE